MGAFSLPDRFTCILRKKKDKKFAFSLKFNKFYHNMNIISSGCFCKMNFYANMGLYFTKDLTFLTVSFIVTV